MFVLFPVVTMGLAAWLIEEPVTLPAVVGAAMVMAGVWFGALSGTTLSGTAASTRSHNSGTT
jgi:drug/metabolite transporter (DMT)-like permease